MSLIFEGINIPISVVGKGLLILGDAELLHGDTDGEAPDADLCADVEELGDDAE